MKDKQQEVLIEVGPEEKFRVTLSREVWNKLDRSTAHPEEMGDIIEGAINQYLG